MNKLYIYTLSWNGCEKLQTLHKSLMPTLNKLNIPWEWHIKDNGSKDNTVDVFKNLNNITCHNYFNNNQNFSEGNNYLFNYTKPSDEDFILLLNNDVIIKNHNSINNMINLFNTDKEIGVVGSKLKYLNTNKLQHAGVVFGNRGLPYHFRAGQNDDSNSSKNRQFQAATGAVLLTKSIYYKNISTDNKSGINGMDEKFIWCYDDIDLCLNIKYAQSKKIVYCGNTDIYHEESSTLKKNPANRLFMNYNINRLQSKWKTNIKLDDEQYANNNYNVL